VLSFVGGRSGASRVATRERGDASGVPVDRVVRTGCCGGRVCGVDPRTSTRRVVVVARDGLDRFNARHPWNHNERYHDWILRNLPSRRDSALDVGCGRGVLLGKLATSFSTVVGIDAGTSARPRLGLLTPSWDSRNTPTRIAAVTGRPRARTGPHGRPKHDVPRGG
jgi:hypothetical protein